jgi:Tfp pilus assembly protein PilO
MNRTPSRSTSDSRGMLITIAAVAGVIGYVMVGFLPAQKALSAKRRELREKQQFIQNSNLRVGTVPQLEAQLKNTRQHVDHWREHAQLEAGGVRLLCDLASLAAQSGVILHRLTPQEPTTLDSLRQFTLELEVEGAYAHVLAFLRGVEERPETIWVPKFQLQPAGEDGGAVQCALSVVVFADNPGKSG